MIIDQAEKILQKQQLEERNGFCAGDRVQITVEIDHGKEGFVKNTEPANDFDYFLSNSQNVHLFFIAVKNNMKMSHVLNPVEVFRMASYFCEKYRLCSRELHKIQEMSNFEVNYEEIFGCRK